MYLIKDAIELVKHFLECCFVELTILFNIFIADYSSLQYIYVYEKTTLTYHNVISVHYTYFKHIKILNLK